MAAATSITPLDRPSGQFQQFTFSLTPGAITTATSEVETVTIPGANVGDAVFITPPAAGFVAGVIVGNGRVSAANTVTFSIFNITGGTITPAAGTFTLTLFRGTTMVFAR